MNKKHVGLWVTAGAAFLPAMSYAAGPSLSDVLVNSGITAAGYVSASYDATLNSTNGSTVGQVPFHQFDTNSNSFYLNQAALTLSYLPTSGFGALVNVIAGEDAKVINGAYSGYGSTNGSDFALTQGYVQYAVGNLTVIGGRYVTLAGEEVIDDSKNANISRSLLFTNLEPLVHTGVRASYKVSDLLTVIGGFNNSAFGYSQDNNKFKTIELGAAITPSSTVSIALADYYGVDGNGPSKTKNNYFDVVGSWQATPALLLAINGDYVRSIGTLDTIPGPFLSVVPSTPPVTGATAGTDTGAGVALYGTYAFNDSWKASLRGEYAYFKAAPSGFTGTGIGHLAEATATVDYSATKSFDVLGEFREDYGSVTAPGFDAGVYPGANNTTTGTQKSQTEFLIKAIYKFGTPVSSS